MVNSNPYFSINFLGTLAYEISKSSGKSWQPIFDILMTLRDHVMTSRDHLGRPNSEITFLSLAHRKINLYMRYGAQMKGLG